MLSQVIKIVLYPLFKYFDKIKARIDRKTDIVLRILSYKENSVVNHRKKVIYTCITGNYDNIVQHSYINFDFDYVCFTDDADLLAMKTYGVWKIRPLYYAESDNTRNNRWHKTHPHILFPEYEESMYIDGNIDMRTNILFNLIKPEDIIRIPAHRTNCIYKEGQVVIKSGKDTAANVQKMIDFLLKEQFPHNYGLNGNGIIYRKHNNEKVIAMMDIWWSYILNYSKRDQLSLSYVLWKFNISPYDITFPIITNDDANFYFYGKH
jgi:hypothetical protein